MGIKQLGYDATCDSCGHWWNESKVSIFQLQNALHDNGWKVVNDTVFCEHCDYVVEEITEGKTNG